jgi:hypothetical protein
LRVGLAEHLAIGNRQLRFRVGQSHSFGADHFGRRRPDDAAYELELDAALLDLAEQVEVAKLSLVPESDVEKRAHRATRWMERAWFSAEPLDALLFMFFALEALLGDVSEGLKGPALAFRTALLGHLVMEGFTNPNETFFLYDEVRSGAVHGEEPPEITWDQVQSFSLTVRWALTHYLKFAREHGFTKRSQLLDAINRDPARDDLIRWLRSYGGEHWSEYLDKLAGMPPKAARA